MTKVFTAQHPAEAHLIKGVLDGQGIPSEVRRESLFGARGEISFVETLPEVWVLNDDQAEEATEVIRGQTTAADKQSWQCSNCGETVEPQFTACWKCNADKA